MRSIVCRRAVTVTALAVVGLIPCGGWRALPMRGQEASQGVRCGGGVSAPLRDAASRRQVGAGPVGAADVPTQVIRAVASIVGAALLGLEDGPPTSRVRCLW